MAERGRFELPVVLPTHDFQSCSLDQLGHLSVDGRMLAPARKAESVYAKTVSAASKKCGLCYYNLSGGLPPGGVSLFSLHRR